MKEMKSAWKRKAQPCISQTLLASSLHGCLGQTGAVQEDVSPPRSELIPKSRARAAGSSPSGWTKHRHLHNAVR